MYWTLEDRMHTCQNMDELNTLLAEGYSYVDDGTITDFLVYSYLYKWNREYYKRYWCFNGYPPSPSYIGPITQDQNDNAIADESGNFFLSDLDEYLILD